MGGGGGKTGGGVVWRLGAWALRPALVLVASLLSAPLAAAPLAPEAVPEPLRPWVPWVLRGHEERECPLLYPSPDSRRCGWPSRLTLALGDAGGEFVQTWRVYADSWLAVPGDARHWPQAARVDGEPALVVERDGIPCVRVGPGIHRLDGRFEWGQLPEALKLPADLGLLSLSVGGAVVDAPEVEADGRLWLRREAPVGAERANDSLDVRVFRRLADEVPFQVLTRIDLDVAGDPREVALGPALPAGAIPLAIDSPLPARLEPDGRLRVQVRPGRWSLTLAARFPGPVGELRLEAAAPPWPAEEVWVFDARPHLRVVEATGLESLDPRQTSLPGDWQGLPTYRARSGDRLTLVERRRGDPEPEPDRLRLDRTVWLDFDGGGATVQDRVEGTMTRGWRLEAVRPLRLGRVAVDGQDQLITRLPGSEREGVEVRRGRVDIVADGRLEGDASQLPALGWVEGFQHVASTLNVPPGWRLLAVSGVDQVRHAWLTRWTLFDLFLLLVASAAVSKLWGWGWGLLALGALGLGYHEPGMPRQVWLYLLAAVALLRVLPAGRLRSAVQLLRWASLVTLVVLALPFLVEQVRVSVFPALERPWQAVQPQPAALEAQDAAAAGMTESDEGAAAPARKVESLRPSAPLAAAPSPYGYASKRAALETYDPRAAVQTGPGLPRWTWESAVLSFNGPVENDAEIRLFLLSPRSSLLWHLLGAVLLAVLLARVAWPAGSARRPGTPSVPPAGTAAAVLVLALGVLLASPARADFPPPELLQELGDRLLEPPDCAPRCAEIPRMQLELAEDSLRLRLEVLALADAAIPLPGAGNQWTPRVVLVDGEPAEALARDPAAGGMLWIALTPGLHQVILEGPLAAGRSGLELALPVRPRRLDLRLDGWRAEGIGPDGVPEGVVRLVRERTAEDSPVALAPTALPPLLRVERSLGLGLEWRVETRVVRLSPPDAAVVAEIALLPGESVTTPAVRVERGRVLVSLAPGARDFAWSSSLARTEAIALEAPATTAWTEVWQLDAGPTWHVEPTGLAPVHRQTQDRWLPEWRPWPGERVTVRVSRPEGVAAPTLTLDGADLKVRPGQRSTDAELELRVRSSQGGQTVVRLPPEGRLQSAAVDGVPQPVRQDGDRVTFPIHPGEQRLTLTWRGTQGAASRLETPAVDVGHPVVNVALTVEVPRSRWVLLTGGPALGPAVLFWGVLAVTLVVAAALGRLRLTPLRTRHWVLLGVGLTQAPAWSAVLVVGWLLALGARVRAPSDLPRWRFNLMQVGLALLTVTALGLLLEAVRQGLLGLPEMQVEGNGSSGYLLRWYQDRSGPELPGAWVVSVPLWVYRGLMLAWALWLAFAVLGWLRWGWDAYRTGGLWRPVSLLPGRLRRG